MERFSLEKYVAGKWHLAGTLEVEAPEKGIASPCSLEYDPQFALDFLDETGEATFGTHFPINFGHERYPVWPAFMLDILPSGFGRDLIVNRQTLTRPDGAYNDCAVLRHGAGNPVGNLRVAEARLWLSQQLRQQQNASGWPLAEMKRHDADFIEYASLHGTLIAGTSTQGQAAKMLLTLGADQLYYGDSVVPDAEARAHYLLKIPRNDQDAILLRHEWLWLRLARQAGLNLHGEPFMTGELLFIPRFDRIVTNGTVLRKNMESAYSLLEVSTPGAPLCHEDILAAFLATANPDTVGRDFVEYFKRDILGFCLRVEDNHGRNTAFFVTTQGLELTPLFDFAPMFLCNDPPVRSTTWRAFDIGCHDQWPRLFHGWLPDLLGAANTKKVRTVLYEWTRVLRTIRQTFATLGRDRRTDICLPRFDAALNALETLQ
jgi:serine/threonine-protein kinase HipA